MGTPEPGFATRAIHAGQEPDPQTGAVIPPIHLSTTFHQAQVGQLAAGFEYSRSGNPTRATWETVLASLEGGGAETDGEARAFAFSSGLAATDTVMRSALRPGDHIVIPNDAYGGTFRLVNSVLTAWGVDYSVARLADPESLQAAIEPGRTKLVWLESPSNPLLSVADLALAAELAHTAGALLVVDNTFATPYLQQPLRFGADVVVHSTTKYLGGHSDVVGGAVVTTDSALAEAVGFLQNAAGAVPSPFDCWLAMRGAKTLAVRMDRHCDNAEAVVAFLAAHFEVLDVYYPGREGTVGAAVARTQMRRMGGMVSFRVSGGEARAREVCARTRIFTLGESLGGVESLIELPAVMTHASTAGSELEVPADLIRLSVGIEDTADLLTDLEHALG